MEPHSRGFRLFIQKAAIEGSMLRICCRQSSTVTNVCQVGKINKTLVIRRFQSNTGPNGCYNIVMKKITKLLRAILLVFVILVEAVLGVLTSFLMKKVTGKHEKPAGLVAAYISAESLVGFGVEIGFESRTQIGGCGSIENMQLS